MKVALAILIALVFAGLAFGGGAHDDRDGKNP